MNFYTPAEITKNYAAMGKAKAQTTLGKMFIMSILAGLFIAFGAAASNTASHSVADVSSVRIISGLLFPFGLCMVILIGAELFTGNNLIVISALNRDTSFVKMFRNWGVVYIGNFIGAVSLAAGCVWSGQMNYSNGGLAAYTIKVAAAKCDLSFGNAIVLGVLCNILVCVGILCSMSAKDTAGRVIGAYIPVVFFVICGFEHCVANMFYAPAGLFAMRISEYAALAAEVGIDTTGLTWANFITHNLLPVTLGNILGGACVGAIMWIRHLRASKKLMVDQ